MPRVAAADPTNWDGVAVKLPPAACNQTDGSVRNDSMACLGATAQLRLETNFDRWVAGGLLVPGVAAAKSKPGSAMVILREVAVGDDMWAREFYCETWTSPNERWRIGVGTDGDCYLAAGERSQTAARPLEMITATSSTISAAASAPMVEPTAVGQAQPRAYVPPSSVPLQCPAEVSMAGVGPLNQVDLCVMVDTAASAVAECDYTLSADEAFASCKNLTATTNPQPKLRHFRTSKNTHSAGHHTLRHSISVLLDLLRVL